MKIDHLLLMRLLRVGSPGLPIGAFSHSQGIEWVVNKGYVGNEAQLEDWLRTLMYTNQKCFDLPIASKLYEAWGKNDLNRVKGLNNLYFASKDCLELRQETLQMGRSLLEIFIQTREIKTIAADFKDFETVTFLTALSYVLSKWSVGVENCLTLILWGWLENQVVAAMKLIPIGHLACQKIFGSLENNFGDIIKEALNIEETSWSNFSLGQSIACAKHETQYSRMFRS